MHSQFSFDEMKSRYAVERRQPCQIIRADDQVPLMAPTRSAGMSAMPPLLGDKRTSRGEPISVAIDPNVWSGRVLQEDFVELAAAVLHQCIRPQIGACCAPGHHGYQRACVLISGQASIGPFGSPVFARARKTDPPFCLVLSQTSAGNC